MKPTMIAIALALIVATIVEGAPVDQYSQDASELSPADREILAGLSEASNMAEGEVDEDDGDTEAGASEAKGSVDKSSKNHRYIKQDSRLSLDPYNTDNFEDTDGQDSNIDNAKVSLSSKDMMTAAGYHHGHGHGVSGKMSMGAHTGHKGAFGWHAKFPVGGKGRR